MMKVFRQNHMKIRSIKGAKKYEFSFESLSHHKTKEWRNGCFIVEDIPLGNLANYKVLWKSNPVFNVFLDYNPC